MMWTMADGRFTAVAPSETGPYAFATFALLAAAVALCLAAVLLGRPRRRRQIRQGAHRPQAGRGEWLDAIDDIRSRFHEGQLDEDDAFAELAALARRFASDRLGRDVTNHTLAELDRLPRSRGGGRGVDLLRQTIRALYPPEFAEPAVHAGPARPTVDEAAGWVSNLVERWRAR